MRITVRGAAAAAVVGMVAATHTIDIVRS